MHHLLEEAWPTLVLLDEHLEVTVAPDNPGDETFYDPIIALEDGSLWGLHRARATGRPRRESHGARAT